MMHYFAKDGSYGDAEGLVLIDTTEWTAFEWDQVEDAHDTDRVAMAKQVDELHQ
jgi:hypothetical protein